MKKLGLVGVIILCALMSGCMETGTEKGVGIGAVSGGVLGGVIGNQLGSTAAGIGIGAVGGAVLGGMIGSGSDKSASASRQKVIAVCPNGHQVDVTGIPPGTKVRCPICGAVFNI